MPGICQSSITMAKGPRAGRRAHGGQRLLA